MKAMGQLLVCIQDDFLLLSLPSAECCVLPGFGIYILRPERTALVHALCSFLLCQSKASVQTAQMFQGQWNNGMELELPC